jgi:hypothetical protein
MCRLSWNLGASASWNPQVLSRPVQGLQKRLWQYFVRGANINKGLNKRNTLDVIDLPVTVKYEIILMSKSKRISFEWRSLFEMKQAVVIQVYFDPKYRLMGFFILLKDCFIKPYCKFCSFCVLNGYKRSECMVCRNLFIYLFIRFILRLIFIKMQTTSYCRIFLRID